MRSIILGVVEGLTEFLPVSSTGHMILVQPLIGVDSKLPQWDTLLWVSQFGAILAVVLYFWRELWQQIIGTPLTDWKRHLLTKLFAAMVPTVIIALALKKTAERYLENPPSVGLALIVGAVGILLVDRFCRKEREMEVADITLTQAFWIGALQCLSLWSGISRSGATIMGGMALGLSPRVATQFSFYLAIPTMLAAAAKTLIKEHDQLGQSGGAIILVGTATAFLSALAVVGPFLAFVKRSKFTPFAIYRIALGSCVLGYYFIYGGK